MRVIEFSGYHGTLHIPAAWTAFTYNGKTYEVVDGKVRLQPEGVAHPKPGRKPQRAGAVA